MTLPEGHPVAVVSEDTAVAPTEVRGIRAGAIVLVGLGVANLGNYLFNLLCARYLGPSSYSDVATLVAITGIIGLPLGGVQVFVARHVARNAARRRPLDDDRYVSGFAATCVVAGLAVTAILLVLSPVIRELLGIRSEWAMVFTVMFAAPSFLAPAFLGAAQGRQQFFLVTAALAIPPLARLILVAVVLVLGFGVTGAMAMTFLGSVAGVLVPLVPLRRELAPFLSWRPRLSRADAIAILPVVGGLLAITALSTDDVLAAKAAFGTHDAGLYGSASLVGRVILYLPTAIVTVLLPKITSRAAANVATADIVGQSLAATAVFCLAATAVYAAVPHFVVGVAFGAKYQAIAHLLWLFGLAMTGYATLNVLLTYHLGHGSGRMSWLLLAGAACQTVVFAVFHSDARELIGSSAVTAFSLILLHEFVCEPILLRCVFRRK